MRSKQKPSTAAEPFLEMARYEHAPQTPKARIQPPHSTARTLTHSSSTHRTHPSTAKGLSLYTPAMSYNSKRNTTCIGLFSTTVHARAVVTHWVEGEKERWPMGVSECGLDDMDGLAESLNSDKTPDDCAAFLTLLHQHAGAMLFRACAALHAKAKPAERHVALAHLCERVMDGRFEKDALRVVAALDPQAAAMAAATAAGAGKGLEAKMTTRGAGGGANKRGRGGRGSRGGKRRAAGKEGVVPAAASKRAKVVVVGEEGKDGVEQEEAATPAAMEEEQEQIAEQQEQEQETVTPAPVPEPESEEGQREQEQEDEGKGPLLIQAPEVAVGPVGAAAPHHSAVLLPARVAAAEVGGEAMQSSTIIGGETVVDVYVDREEDWVALEEAQ